MRWLEMFLWSEVDIPPRVFYSLLVSIAVLAAIAFVYGDQQLRWWLKEVMKR